MNVKLKIGLFGAVVNILIVIGILSFSAATRGPAGVGAYLTVLPALAASAFVVYYGVVSSYAAKRAGIAKPLFYDSLVGMLAELIIVTLGVVLYTIVGALLDMQGGNPSAVLAAIATGVLMNLLWVFATFMIHILIVGNIAGLAGWYLLKKMGTKTLS